MKTLKEYFKDKHGFDYPAQRGELDQIWQPRLYETMAEYVEYALKEKFKEYDAKIPMG